MYEAYIHVADTGSKQDLCVCACVEWVHDALEQVYIGYWIYRRH